MKRSQVVTGAAALAAAAAAGVGGALALDSGGGDGSTTTTTTVPPTTTTTTTVPPTTTTTQGYPSLAYIDFDGDYDPSCSLTGSNGGWDRNLSGSDHPGTATIERSIVAEGNCSAKFVVPGSTGQTRANLERKATGFHPELTYEGLVFVPSGQSFPKGVTIFDAKQEVCFNGGVEINDGTGTTGGTMEFRTVPSCNHEKDFQMGPLPRDKWFAVKVHEKFSQDPSVGFVEAWVDHDGTGPAGYTQVVQKSYVDNEVTDTNPQTVRLREGQYRQFTDHTTTIYMDGYHMQCQADC
jgi:hypothetical protein